jgi:hypothetical protein
MWSRLPARPQPSSSLLLLPPFLLLLVLSVLPGPAAGLYEGRIGFTRTRVAVHEGAGVVQLTVTRECHRAMETYCNGRVSVAYSTETPFVARVPHNVTVRDGSPWVDTGGDLRGWVYPGEPVSIMGQELRVQRHEAGEFNGTRFMLNGSFGAHGLRAYVSRVNVAAPGFVAVEQGSSVVEFGEWATWRGPSVGGDSDGPSVVTPGSLSGAQEGNLADRLVTVRRDMRKLLSYGDFVRLEGRTFVVKEPVYSGNRWHGLFTATHLTLDRAYDGPGNNRTKMFTSREYVGLTDSFGRVDVRVSVNTTSFRVNTTGDLRGEIGVGDFIKIGPRNYVTAAVAQRFIILTSPFREPTVVNEYAYKDLVDDRLPGNVTVWTGSDRVHTTYDLRDEISIGDTIKIEGENFEVRVGEALGGGGRVVEGRRGTEEEGGGGRGKSARGGGG